LYSSIHVATRGVAAADPATIAAAVVAGGAGGDLPRAWRWGTRAVVQAQLALRWSPQQVSRRLRLDYPHDPTVRVSHETICTLFTCD
jgi:hypothetical protein